MIYLIYGNQGPSIKSKIRKTCEAFLGQEKPDELNYIKLDGHNSVVQDAVDECKYVALGYEKKVVSLENCYFLLKPKPRNKIESDQNYDELLDYVTNNYQDNDACLILSVCSSSIDEKGALYKAIKEHANILQIVDPDEKGWNEYVKAYLNKHEVVIDRDAMMELAARTENDVGLFQNYVEILSLYTDHVRYKDVILMVNKPLEDNAFLIFNLLIDKRNAEAVNLFRDLLVKGFQPITLVNQLAGQFRLLSEVSYLARKRMSKDDIASELKIKPGRVYILSKHLATVSDSAIKRALEDLYQLDFDIKSGQIDRNYGFELFLLKFQTQ